MIVIRDSLDRYLRGRTRDGERVFSLLVNPNEDELAKLKKEEYDNIGNFSLRALLINKTKLYVWCAEKASHHQVMEKAGFNEEDLIPLFLYLNNKYQIESLAYSNEIRSTIYKNPVWELNVIKDEKYYNEILQPILKKCSAITKIAASNISWKMISDA